MNTSLSSSAEDNAGITKSLNRASLIRRGNVLAVGGSKHEVAGGSSLRGVRIDVGASSGGANGLHGRSVGRACEHGNSGQDSGNHDDDADTCVLEI